MYGFWLCDKIFALRQLARVAPQVYYDRNNCRSTEKENMLVSFIGKKLEPFRMQFAYFSRYLLIMQHNIST